MNKKLKYFLTTLLLTVSITSIPITKASAFYKIFYPEISTGFFTVGTINGAIPFSESQTSSYITKEFLLEAKAYNGKAFYLEKDHNNRIEDLSVKSWGENLSKEKQKLVEKSGKSASDNIERTEDTKTSGTGFTSIAEVMKKQEQEEKTVIPAATISPIIKAGWAKNDFGDWFYSEDGSKWYKSCWKQINNNWYYFFTDGSMVHDTIIDGYKINSDGVCDSNGNTSIIQKSDFYINHKYDSKNFIDAYKSVGGEVSSIYIKGIETDKNFATNRNLTFDDTYDKVKLTYGNGIENKKPNLSICANYPNLAELSVTHSLIYDYYENYKHYKIEFFFNSENKITMVAYYQDVTTLFANNDVYKKVRD